MIGQPIFGVIVPPGAILPPDPVNREPLMHSDLLAFVVLLSLTGLAHAVGPNNTWDVYFNGGDTNDYN